MTAQSNPVAPALGYSAAARASEGGPQDDHILVLDDVVVKLEEAVEPKTPDKLKGVDIQREYVRCLTVHQSGHLHGD